MRKILLIGVTALLLASLASPLLAATANFQCNCSSSFPNNCVCDARRPAANPTSCGSASPTFYFWDWGDGSSTSGSSAFFASHTYPAGTSLDICMSVFCSDGSSADRCHCFHNFIGLAWCVRPIGSWTP